MLRDKFKNMLNVTGRDPMIFKYEELFDEVMGEDRADINVQTMDSSMK